MIQEDYCSLELSKLLKEKGFDEECDWFYEEVGDLNRRTRNGCDKYINSLLDYGEYAAPTHQMAMKWLREKDIDVIIMPLFKIKEGRIYCYEIHSDNTDVRVGQFETYKEAVEAAIKYSLENLI